MITTDNGAARRVAGEIVDLLAAVPMVAAVSLFGSLAEERADAWSDVDLHVACMSEAGRWAAAAAIRAGKPVEFYRTFTGGIQPSGRYWFTDESPFQKIDISFFTLAEYREKQAHPLVLGLPVTLREVYVRADGACAKSMAQPAPLELTEGELEIGRRVYRLSLSAKARGRGKADGQYLDEDIAGLRAAFGDRPPNFTAGGGHLGRLVARMLAAAEYIRAHYPL